MKQVSKWQLLALIAGFVFVADQVTKYLAVEHLTALFDVTRARTLPSRLRAVTQEKELVVRGLTNPEFVQVIPGLWQHRYLENRGAAWGVLAGTKEKVRVPFFYLVSIGAVIFIFSYYRKLEESQRYLQIALALVLGGAIGNALDRVLRGYVIDFIDWHWFDPNWMRPALHWPTFNVADSGITVGLVMLAVEALFFKKPKKA